MNTQEIIQNAVDDYNSESNGHSKFPPSGAKRWCNCTASYNLVGKLGDIDTSNKYTAEGSLAHILCELVLTQKIVCKRQLDEAIGDTYILDDFEIEVTEEMTEAVMLYGETIAHDILEAGFNENNYKKLVFVEQKFKITDDCYGTSDCTMFVPFTKIVVYDFKYGAGVPVDVEDNYQMKCYGVGALKMYQKLDDLGIDEVELVIIQPRSRHKDGAVRRWTTTVKDIMDFGDFIEEKIEECKSGKGKLNPDSWCRWCPAKHNCPKLFEETEEIAKEAFDVVETHDGSLVALSDDQLKRILRNKDTIVGFIKSVENLVIDRLNEGGELEGYKLVRGSSTRKWIDDDEAFQMANKLLPEEMLYEKKFLSPAKMEKKLKKEGACKTVVEAKEYISDYIEQSEGKISLAPEHDKREAITGSDASKHFDEI